jgi:hypothetical protein
MTEHIYCLGEGESHHKLPRDKLARKTTGFVDAALIVLERVEMPF